MINNLRHNYLWLISALETYGLGAYFIATHSTGNFTPPPNSVLDMLDDPPFIFLLGVAGTSWFLSPDTKQGNASEIKLNREAGKPSVNLVDLGNLFAVL